MPISTLLLSPAIAILAAGTEPPAPLPAIGPQWRESLASEHSFLRVPDERPDITIFQLPGEAPLVAVQTSATRFAWEGRIIGERDSLALVASTSQGPVTVLRSKRLGTVQAIPLRRNGDRLELRILSTLEELPPCLGAQQPEKEGNNGSAGSLRAGDDGGVAADPCDDGRRLDVLVRWTPLAQSQAGGAMAIRAIAEASIAVSNHVYRTSGVALELRAVEIGPSEPFDLDLDSGLLTKLRLTDDGHLDLVHAERDALGADLVALLSGSNPGYCGVAYLIGGNSPHLGFSVTVWNCAVGNLTFTHEIGHNQGCCHAPGDGGGCTSGGIHPYSVGYRYTGSSGTQWRSVLAYSPGTRWPRLSSPEVVHDGQPFGTANADNARTVRETALTLANFRCTAVTESDSGVQIDSGLQPVPANGVPLLVAAAAPPRAHAGGEVEFELVAIGDLGALEETLSLRVGSLDLGVILGGVGSDCRIATGRRSIAAAAFNGQLAADGSLSILIVPSAAVDPICQSSELQLQVRYEPAPAAVPGDLNGDGRVDGGDLGVLLSSWGPCRGCPADLDGDGVVNGADLALLLSFWSE